MDLLEIRTPSKMVDFEFVQSWRNSRWVFLAVLVTVLFLSVKGSFYEVVFVSYCVSYLVCVLCCFGIFGLVLPCCRMVLGLNIFGVILLSCCVFLYTVLRWSCSHAVLLVRFFFC